MTFPVVQNVRRGVSDVAVTSRNVRLPATINAGDLLLALFVSAGSSTVTWDNVTAGSWTQLHSTLQADGEVRLSAFWKIASGSEDDVNLSVATAAATRSLWNIYRVSGADQIQAATPSAPAGTTNSPNPPSLTPSWGADDTLWIVAVATADFPTDDAPPSAYAATATGDGATTCALGSAYRTANTATEDPAVWGLTPALETVINTYAARYSGGVPLAPPLTSSPAVFYGPTITPGPVTLTAPLTSSPAAFYGPTISTPALVQAERFDSVAVFFAPAMEAADQPLAPPFFESRVAFFKPVVGGGVRVAPTFTGIAIGGGTQTGFDWDDVDERWDDIDSSWALFTKGGVVSAPISAVFGDLAIHSSANAGVAFEQTWALRGPIGFADFRAFIPGEYEFTEAVVWMSLRAPQPFAQVLSITRAMVNVDVPDVTDRGIIDIPSGGAWVDLNRSFYNPPSVVASCVKATGITVAPKVIVHDDPPVEIGRFFVTVCTGDDLANTIDGRISWVATGF